jgi:hypothetical protein
VIGAGSAFKNLGCARIVPGDLAALPDPLGVTL